MVGSPRSLLGVREDPSAYLHKLAQKAEEKYLEYKPEVLTAIQSLRDELLRLHEADSDRTSGKTTCKPEGDGDTRFQAHLAAHPQPQSYAAAPRVGHGVEVWSPMAPPPPGSVKRAEVITLQGKSPIAGQPTACPVSTTTIRLQSAPSTLSDRERGACHSIHHLPTTSAFLAPSSSRIMHAPGVPIPVGCQVPMVAAPRPLQT